jgi:hypothetical protein
MGIAWTLKTASPVRIARTMKTASPVGGASGGDAGARQELFFYQSNEK